MRSYKTKYTQTALYILLLIAVFAVMGFTRRCGSSSSLPVINKGDSMGDTIDVAVIYGPLSFYTYSDSLGTDTLGGLNYDMLTRMELETKRPVTLWPVSDLHEALEALQKGKYDMLASIPADADVKERFLTTRSVFLDRLVLIQLKDSLGNVKISSALDLGPDTVFIERESPAALRLKNLSDEIGHPIPAQEVNLSEEYLCMKVASGEYPLAVVNEKTAQRMQASYPNLSFDNPVSFTQFQVWIMPQADTLLLKQTDEWLSTFLDTEDYQNLIKRYNPE